MKLKRNGMELLKDTASVSNALMENAGVEGGIKAGDTFAELMWTDRHLWVVTRVVSEREFFARRAVTRMEHWADGYEYPVKDESGNIQIVGGNDSRFLFRYRNWRKDGVKIHLAFGATTGYRDPSF